MRVGFARFDCERRTHDLHGARDGVSQSGGNDHGNFCGRHDQVCFRSRHGHTGRQRLGVADDRDRGGSANSAVHGHRHGNDQHQRHLDAFARGRCMLADLRHDCSSYHHHRRAHNLHGSGNRPGNSDSNGDGYLRRGHHEVRFRHGHDHEPNRWNRSG